MSTVGPSAQSSLTIFETLTLVPFIVDVHDEKSDWGRLKDSIHVARGVARGLGIPTGGGAAYYSDCSIRPLRKPLSEFELDGDVLRHKLLFPMDGEIIESGSAVH